MPIAGLFAARWQRESLRVAGIASDGPSVRSSQFARGRGNRKCPNQSNSLEPVPVFAPTPCSSPQRKRALAGGAKYLTTEPIM